MQSLQINTGEIKLAINDDPNRVIAFNPSNALFAERFYNLMGDFKSRLIEYRVRMDELEKHGDTDENGIVLNIQEHIDIVKEANNFMRAKIDDLFGVGTSQTVFGDALVMDAFTQFFEGILPFIQQARKDKINKYSNKRNEHSHRRAA